MFHQDLGEAVARSRVVFQPHDISNTEPAFKIDDLKVDPDTTMFFMGMPVASDHNDGMAHESFIVADPASSASISLACEYDKELIETVNSDDEEAPVVSDDVPPPTPRSGSNTERSDA